MEIFVTHSEATWFRVHGLFRVTAFFIYITGNVGAEPGFSYKSPVVTAKWGCDSLKNFSKGPRDLKEGGISARKTAQMWGLNMKKSTLQVRLNAKVSGFSRPHPRHILVICHVLSHGIFGIDCQTFLQAQEKSIKISRLPAEIYV